MQIIFRQITKPAPHHSNFYRPDALPDAQPTVSSTEGNPKGLSCFKSFKHQSVWIKMQ